MITQSKIKVWKRTIARNALYFCDWFINKLPYNAVRLVTHVLLAIGFRCTIKQKRIARESLNIAFRNKKSPKEINKIVRGCFENFGRGMIELIYFIEHPEMVRNKVFFEGKEHLARAFQEGKGVIAVTAHFGNFPLMLMKCVQEGYKTNAIIRATRDQLIEKYFLQQRTKRNINTIYSLPRRQCVDTCLKVLRQNELLFIPLDQNFGSKGGVFVDFFGRKAATATGPVIFARRTKSPVVPMFIIRMKNDTHKIIIEPPFTIEEQDDEKETIRVNITRITKIIENYIRKYPEEWGWMHRRWKSRPPGEKEEE